MKWRQVAMSQFVGRKMHKVPVPQAPRLAACKSVQVKLLVNQVEGLA